MSIQDLVLLYVEDDARSRKVMRMATDDMGLSSVYIFEDSTNFVERVHALDPKPNVIFLDVHVPPYDGFEMLNMLRQSEKFAGTPIVAMTASVMNEEVHRLRTAGFDGCIAKPLDMDTFPELVDLIVSGENIWRI